jgi:photosynthetic reaction center H subunit
MKGAITGYMDVAQVLLYVFWGFFAGLIYYLHREGKREGYPLLPDNPAFGKSPGLFGMPAPKTFLLPHGGTASFPNASTDTRTLMAKPSSGAPGSPLVPTGDPMRDGVGPAAWAERSDKPDLTIDGKPRIVPLRRAEGYAIESRDPDPRGMPVIGADKKQAGTVLDAWVDTSECLIRYLEVDAGGSRTVLLPINFAAIDRLPKQVRVNAILAHQFAHVPVTQESDSVTRREEDKICGYYGGGTLYATPQRSEPLI